MPDFDSTCMSPSQAAAATVAERAAEVVRGAQRLRYRLQTTWDEVNGCLARARTRIPEYKQELRDEATRVAGRARFYHRTRPLATLGVIAAAAFVAGIAIGLGRR